MSLVLSTFFKSNSQDKDGFLSVQDMLNEGCTWHIFKGCLNVKVLPDEQHVSQWLAYWEGFPYAVCCTVSSTVLSNGYLKLTILDKKLVDFSDVGDYTYSKNYTFGTFVKEKFVSKKDLPKYIDNVMMPKVLEELAKPKVAPVRKEPKPRTQKANELSTDKIQEFKDTISKNWGCRFK